MKRLHIALILLFMMVSVASAFAGDSIDEDTLSAAKKDVTGEGLIEQISESTIRVNDTLMIFPDSLKPRAENGDYILRAHLHVGDKVFYHANSDRVLYFIGKFDKK